MRVDLIITELFVGGAERCLTELALGLQHHGDRVRVASIGSLPQGPQAVLLRRLRDAGIDVVTTECDSPLRAVQAFARLRHWMTTDRPDVVQTMLFHANVLGTWAARSAGVATCVGGIRVADTSRGRLWIEQTAISRMDALVCVSDSVARFAERSFSAPLPPTLVIPNSIDSGRIAAASAIDWTDLGWPANAEVLLFIGRLDYQKGIDVLLDAMPELFARLPDLRCCFVGEGPLRPQIDQAVSRFGAARVCAVGWRSDSDSFLKASRLLVLPSRYEGMPNVVLEAMAAGKVVAVSLVEGVSELLGDTTDHQTCRPDDSVALAALIESLWKAPRQRLADLADQNRRRAEQNHDLEAMIDRYRQLYRSFTD